MEKYSTQKKKIGGQNDGWSFLMKGIFTISLDFELHWGGFEKWNVSTYRDYFLQTRILIPKMLKLFERYDVHVTWAAVGFLFHETRSALMANVPLLRPSYVNPKLSAYAFMDEQGIGINESEDPLHFGHSLIKKILNTPNQELGSHTFSHFYCNEAGQTVAQFRADLQSAQKAAAAFGIKLYSLVFPRNQFNDEYLKVCFEEGFYAVRSNPIDWFWQIASTQREGKWKRLNRGLDAYFPLGKKNTYSVSGIQLREGFPVCLPASRLLRPYQPHEWFLNQLKVTRIIREMNRAASHGEMYHLWWHPHNFARYPEKSLEVLEQILNAYRKNFFQYGMQSLSMGEVAQLIRQQNEKEATA